MDEHGKFNIDNPPEIVNRFIKLCEAFQKHATKSANGLGNHELYFNSMNSLEVWGNEETPSYKIKGVGQVHRGLSGPAFEINEFLLTGLEKRFGLTDNPLLTDVNQSVFTQLQVNLERNDIAENKDKGQIICSVKTNALIAQQFMRNKRIMPETGMTAINVSYDRESNSIDFKGDVSNYSDPIQFRESLLASIVDNKLSIFRDINVSIEAVILNKIFRTPLPILIEEYPDGEMKLIHDKDGFAHVASKDDYVYSISKQLNNLHELTREKDHEMNY